VRQVEVVADCGEAFVIAQCLQRVTNLDRLRLADRAEVALEKRHAAPVRGAQIAAVLGQVGEQRADVRL